MHQFASIRPVVCYLKEHGLKYKTRRGYSAAEWASVTRLFCETVGRFSGAQKSALVNLAYPCGGAFAMTTMYLLGRCSEREWWNAVFARTPEVCLIISDRPIGGIGSVPDDSTPEAREAEIQGSVDGLADLCVLVRKYLDSVQANCVA